MEHIPITEMLLKFKKNPNKPGGSLEKFKIFLIKTVDKMWTTTKEDIEKKKILLFRYFRYIQEYQGSDLAVGKKEDSLEEFINWMKDNPEGVYGSYKIQKTKKV